MRRELAVLGLMLALPALVGLTCRSPISVGLPDASGQIPVRFALPAGTDPSSVRLRVDGIDVSERFSPGGPGVVGTLPVPPPGRHEILASRNFGDGPLRLGFRKRFDSPQPAPALVAAAPSLGARVPRSAWLRFDFDAPVAPEALTGWGFGIECGGSRIDRSATQVAGNTLIVNPAPELPAGTGCRILWRGPNGCLVEHAFVVAAGLPFPPTVVHYDRDDLFALSPFPDDFWLVPDAGTSSGRRVQIDVGLYTGGLLPLVVEGVRQSIADSDGFSPVQPMVLDFSGPVEPSSVPADEFASIDPMATIALFDMDPDSPDYGKRIPFTIRVRSDRRPDFRFDYTGLLFPAVMLREGGTYALVVTRRVYRRLRMENPFEASPFFEAVMEPPTEGESSKVARARESIEPALTFLESVPIPTIPREDVALALRISIRSQAFDPSDLIAVKEAALASAPPTLDVTSVAPRPGRNSIVRGTIQVPVYLVPDTALTQINRDPATGRPVAAESVPVPFVLSLPDDPGTGPVPIVIYQHGSPGSPEEILSGSEEFLDDAGYAMIGIQDVDNRLFGESIDNLTTAQFAALTFFWHLPLSEFHTFSDMFQLTRAIQGLSGRSWLPGSYPAGAAEIDPTRILYRGISQGSNYALAFLPLSPEVRAAASVVGAGRIYQNIIHQVDTTGLIAGLQALVPTANPGLLFFGLAVLQNDADRQDSHYMARHLYRDPLTVSGQTDPSPASLLWIEGIGDTWVSNTGTRAAADEMGIPQVGRVRRESPILNQADAPLSENIAPGVTAGHYQYEIATTPSCLARGETEGHFCPQSALEAEQQILHFFATALNGPAPEIIDPLPGP